VTVGTSPTRARILRAAGRLFVEQGYPAVTMRAIAGGLGMTAAGLYAHYPSKAALLGDYVETELKRFVYAVEERVGRASGPAERLRAFAEGHVLSALAEAELGPYNVQFALKQLAPHLAPEGQADLIAFQRRHLRLLTGIIGEGVEASAFRVREPTVTAFAILTMCDFVTNWYRTDGRLDAEAVARHHGELALRMVGAANGG
jgi:AcrR family transcriptional regulator